MHVFSEWNLLVHTACEQNEANNLATKDANKENRGGWDSKLTDKQIT